MAVETERKFLLANDGWRNQVGRSTEIRQGYLNSAPERAVRIRVRGERGTLTIKGLGNGMSRPEFEYDIPLAEAQEMLQMCETPRIEKIRHEVRVGEHLWEIDEFTADNEGLIIAEVELADEQESFVLPGWLGEEVTSDPRYFNVSLIKHPFCTWAE